VLKPVATTEVATNVTSSGATLKANINPEGWETTYHLEYGTTTSYGTKAPVPDAALASESAIENVSQVISGLQPETAYDYRVVATNPAGVSDGSNHTFTTLAADAPPVYVGSFGSEGSEDGQFNQPTGLALDNSGHLWVDDSEHCRVQEFTEAGSYLSAFGGICGIFFEEWEIGSRALRVDNKGHAYLLIGTTSLKIREVTEAGKEVRTYSGPVDEWGEVYDFAVDSHGDVWVPSAQYGDVLEYNEAGEKLRVVGSKGSGAGQFENPHGIAIGPNGDVWVTDKTLDKVVEFNEKGEYLRQFGTAGGGNGQLDEPTVIAVDSIGDAWVIDQGNHRVEEFNEKGEYKTQFGADGKGAGQFEKVGGIAISSKRAFYLTDTYNDRVEKWE
jgi:tripartite motif-containing protein 71